MKFVITIFLSLFASIAYSQSLIEFNKKNVKKIIHLDSLGVYSAESFYYANNHIYFSDYVETKIRSFSMSQVLKNEKIILSEWGYGRGKGPGENLAIISFGVANNTLFISDKSMNKISLWTENEYIKDITFNQAGFVPSYMAVSDSDSKLYLFSKNKIHDGLVFSHSAKEPFDRLETINITNEESEKFFLIDVKRVAKDNMLVVGPFNNPFIYIIRNNKVKKVRTSSLIDENKILSSNGFFGAKTIKAKYNLYFNMGIDIDIKNKRIIVGLAESEYSNIQKLLILDYNGNELKKVNLEHMISSFLIVDDLIMLNIHNANQNYNKMYVFNLNEIYE